MSGGAPPKPTDLVLSTLQTVILRELGAVRRTVEAYPDDASLWAERPGLPNVGGTLVLHVAGNLQHYIGAVLGKSGYRRDRDAEFSRRDVPRAALLGEIDAARQAVERGMPVVSEDALAAPYPEPIAGRTVATGDFSCIWRPTWRIISDSSITIGAWSLASGAPSAPLP